MDYGFRCVFRAASSPARLSTDLSFGVQYSIGSVFLLAGAWVRYAGTAKSLNSHGAYALLIIGQVRICFLVDIPNLFAKDRE